MLWNIYRHTTLFAPKKSGHILLHARIHVSLRLDNIHNCRNSNIYPPYPHTHTLSLSLSLTHTHTHTHTHTKEKTMRHIYLINTYQHPTQTQAHTQLEQKSFCLKPLSARLHVYTWKSSSTHTHTHTHKHIQQMFAWHSPHQDVNQYTWQHSKHAWNNTLLSGVPLSKFYPHNAFPLSSLTMLISFFQQRNAFESGPSFAFSDVQESVPYLCISYIYIYIYIYIYDSGQQRKVYVCILICIRVCMFVPIWKEHKRLCTIPWCLWKTQEMFGDAMHNA